MRDRNGLWEDLTVATPILNKIRIDEIIASESTKGLGRIKHEDFLRLLHMIIDESARIACQRFGGLEFLVCT